MVDFAKLGKSWKSIAAEYSGGIERLFKGNGIQRSLFVVSNWDCCYVTCGMEGNKVYAFLMYEYDDGSGMTEQEFRSSGLERRELILFNLLTQTSISTPTKLLCNYASFVQNNTLLSSVLDSASVNLSHNINCNFSS